MEFSIIKRFYRTHKEQQSGGEERVTVVSRVRVGFFLLYFQFVEKNQCVLCVRATAQREKSSSLEEW